MTIPSKSPVQPFFVRFAADGRTWSWFFVIPAVPKWEDLKLFYFMGDAIEGKGEAVKITHINFNDIGIEIPKALETYIQPE